MNSWSNNTLNVKNVLFSIFNPESIIFSRVGQARVHENKFLNKFYSNCVGYDPFHNKLYNEGTVIYYPNGANCLPNCLFKTGQRASNWATQNEIIFSLQPVVLWGWEKSGPSEAEGYYSVNSTKLRADGKNIYACCLLIIFNI